MSDEAYEYDETYAEEEVEEDTTINNSDVVVKYKKGAQWVNETITEIVKLCVPGAKVADICKEGDKIMLEKVKGQFKCDKGIAVPTSISINNCACGYSPVQGEETTPLVIQANDMVKIDLGIQVDGYPSVAAHTILATENGQLPPDCRETNLIQAASVALNTAIRKFRPGATNTEVTEILEKTAEHFGVQTVDGVLSHSMKRYIVDGFRCIPGKKIPEHAVHEYPFENAQVWALDVVYTTGKGLKLREKDFKTAIYKVDIESEFKPKMDSSREVKKEIDAKYTTFPFNVRNLEASKARLGLSELLKHGAVQPTPALYEKDGELVAQFKVTILITNKKIERITGIPTQEFPEAAKAFTDEMLLETSKLPMSLVDKKKKK